MLTIYHNPRCSKSREGLAILEAEHANYQVVKYMDEPLTKSELKNIIQLLKIKPIELVRTKEAIWRETYKNTVCTDADIIAAMAAHPQLIERPIVINGNKAVIGRPPQKILEIL